MHSIKAQTFDWNVSLSPLDGAVVEKRKRGKGGGTSLCADVNKNSHFKPVCALTDHSKHYARRRGWTTLGYSTEMLLIRAWGDEDREDRAPPRRFYPPPPFSVFSGLRVCRCRVWCLVPSPLPILSYVPVSGRGGERHGGMGCWGGGVWKPLVQEDEENKRVQIWFLMEDGRASKRVLASSRSLLILILIFILVLLLILILSTSMSVHSTV